jgi:hypothetical protein
MTRKPIIYTADAARMDEVSDGMHAIVIDTDEGDKLLVNIHDCALAFYASVQAQLRPWVLEAEHAHATMPLPELEPITASVDMDLVRDIERLPAIGAIRLTAGNAAAQRCVDRLNTEGT